MAPTTFFHIHYSLMLSFDTVLSWATDKIIKHNIDKYFSFYLYLYLLAVNAVNLVFISRYLREQMGNQQVELPFQNFSPENFTHLQNYNVGLYIYGSVDSHVILQKE